MAEKKSQDKGMYGRYSKPSTSGTRTEKLFNV